MPRTRGKVPLKCYGYSGDIRTGYLTYKIGNPPRGGTPQKSDNVLQRYEDYLVFCLDILFYNKPCDEKI